MDALRTAEGSRTGFASQLLLRASLRVSSSGRGLLHSCADALVRTGMFLTCAGRRSGNCDLPLRGFWLPEPLARCAWVISLRDSGPSGVLGRHKTRLSGTCSQYCCLKRGSGLAVAGVASASPFSARSARWGLWMDEECAPWARGLEFVDPPGKLRTARRCSSCITARKRSLSTAVVARRVIRCVNGWNGSRSRFRGLMTSRERG